MAQLVFTNGYTLINSVDLSDHNQSVTLNAGAVMLNDTVMGDTFESNAAGIQQWSIDLDYIQDYAASEIDATLFPLLGASAFTVEVRPVNSARSATNPGYNGSAVLRSYGALTGSHGDLLKARASFASAGLLSRSTSA